MTTRPCDHEEAVLAATLDASGRPLADALVAHLGACRSCRELHDIASVLHDDHATALVEARVPSAGQTWWRAELRARQDAAAMAARPITVVTGLAAACLIGLLASLTGLLAWWLQDAWTMPATVQVMAGRLATAVVAPTGVGLALWLALGVLLVATPLMLYVALRDD
ncbi:hypothetical protein [Luteitalea sp.]|uniref:hypothetical protein n=1 Tax=Luteitalea sp. TaxID=2004800 RepID=UPI0025BE2932|nr:hypothetical protein [Luteitalea sp.]